MGEISFSRKDFLDWEEVYDTDPEKIRSLHNLVKNLGDDLAKYLGNHTVIPEYKSRNYIGINILDNNKYKDKKPVQVPPWSLAIAQNGAEPRTLLLYITCIPKKLTNMFLKDNELQDKLADVLNNDRIRGNPRIALKVLERIFLRRSGKKEWESIYTTYSSFPFELCKEEQDVIDTITQAFKAMSQLNDHTTRESRTKEWPDDTFCCRNRSVSGVLQLIYHLNWLELEKLGVDVGEKLEHVVDLLKPFYRALIDSAPADQL